MSYVTIILVIAILLCCIFLANQLTYWKRLNVPFVPLKFPYIFGNVSGKKHVSLQFADFYQNHRTHPIVGIFTLLKKSVLIVDLELMQSILSEKIFPHFQDRGMYFNEKDPLSRILGCLNFERWKPLRAKLTPAFTPGKIKNMFNTIEPLGNELVKGLDEAISNGENQVELRDIFSRYMIDVIGAVAIGIRCDTLNSANELKTMIKKAMQPYLKFPWNILTVAYPGIARVLGIRKHPKEVTDFFMNIIEQTIEDHKLCVQNGEKRNDYIQLLIDSGLKSNEIAALAFDLLSAGYADSTSTLAYCLYELSLPTNKHIQEKAREEILSSLAANNGQLTYDMLNEMVYCKQIINETLRKHPVAGNVTRITTKPYKVPNMDFTIPKGMRVYIPIFGIHHDAAFFPEPEEFIPERFSDREEPRAFLPFGDGPRKCIGLRFAKLLIRIGLVSLLQHFEFSTCDRTQIPIQYCSTKNTLIPSAGVWLEVRRI